MGQNRRPGIPAAMAGERGGGGRALWLRLWRALTSLGSTIRPREASTPQHGVGCWGQSREQDSSGPAVDRLPEQAPSQAITVHGDRGCAKRSPGGLGRTRGALTPSQQEGPRL